MGDCDAMASVMETAGVRLAYEDCHGPGRPLVLVHGFTGNRDDFRDHYGALCEIGRTVIYDHRGHGDSIDCGNAAAYTFDILVRDLEALLRELDIESCDLLGHSMGGMVALRYALAHSERVASLILMDTSARIPDGFMRAVFSAGGALAMNEGMERLVAVARAMGQGDPNRPAAAARFEQRVGTEVYWDRHRRRMLAMDPAAFGALGVEMCDQEPLTDRLSEIACPTTIIVGEEDTPFLQPSVELELGIPGARRVVIADAAHSPQLENPDQWWAAIVDHLRWARS